jgi:cytochrome c biogenesis protein CcmG/thiol:disulfide interchange protein DsbE
MSRYLKFLIPGVLFLILVVFFVIGLQRDPRMIPSPLIGKPAPEFALEDLSDPQRTVGTSDFAGRMYLFNVWGTWCVGLNWKDDRSLAQRWLRQLGNPYETVAFDPEGQVAIDWGVYGAPETFLVAADGTVLAKRIGPMTMDVWQREFLPLISGSGGAS